jgi:hypothetical protein
MLGAEAVEMAELRGFGRTVDICWRPNRKGAIRVPSHRLRVDLFGAAAG